MTTPAASFMTAADVARELGLSRVRVYALMGEKRIPSIRLGRAIRVPRDAWTAWLAAKRDQALAVSAE